MFYAPSKRLLPLVALATLLAGCSSTVGHIATSTPLAATSGMHGSVHGGQQPIVGATIQLYAVGTTGDGSASTSILNAPYAAGILTGPAGDFDLTSKFTCPQNSTLVYIVATGGNPGLPPPFNNAASTLISALGPCGNPNNINFINLNEVTTVAAVYALAPFMSSPTAIGSGVGDAQALADAFTLAMQYANPTTGTSPGANVPPGTTIPTAQINTLANLLSACVNSVGGVAGDASVCGQLFTLTTPGGGTPATDTTSALLHLALNPDLNTQALYNLILPTAPFQPTLNQQPPDFGVRATVPSDFTVSPTSMNFGSIFVGGNTQGQALSISNNTTHALAVNSVSLSGPNPNDFGIYNTCPSPLLPNSSCTLQLNFTPTAAGARSAYLVVKNTSPNPYIAIPLSGTGSAGTSGPVTVSPSSLDFTLLNTPQSVTLTNDGNTPLTISGGDFSFPSLPGYPDPYTQTNNCSATIAAHAFCTINITAHNTVSATPGTLTLRDDAAAGPQVINLTYSGTGYIPPDSLDFGDESIGGQAPLPIQVTTPDSVGSLGFALSGPDASEFSFASNMAAQQGTCSYALPGTPCFLQIFFNPTTLGPKTATVTIPGVGKIPVTGNGISAGVHFNLTPTTVNFSTPFGQSQTQVIAVRNVGTIIANLNLPVISGPHAADFSSTTTCVNDASSGPTGCQINLTYTPSSSGPTSEQATVTDLTNTAQQTFNINTDTVSSPLTVSPNQLTFASTPAGSISTAQSATVTAITSNPVNASIIGPFQFTSGATCASTPCQLSVAFAPAANSSPGYKTGQLTVVDPYTGTRGFVYLIGTSTAVTISSLSTSSLTFAAQTVSTLSDSQTVTVTNTGANNVLTFSSVALSGANTSDFTVSNGCTTNVVPGSSCTISVAFIPQTTGPRTATLTINSNATASPQTVSLSGTGQ